RRNTRRPPITAMKARTRRSPARPATCRSAPIWWSIGGTITVSAYHVPTSRQGSARRMLATTAMPTNRRNGRRPRSRLGTERTAKAGRNTPKPSIRPGPAKPMRRPCLGWSPPIPTPRPRARASALTELAPYVSPANINLARSALADPDPTVRIGALDMLANVSAAQIWPLVSPLLADSNRGVRIRAVALLAAVPTASQPPADRESFERAAAEFVAAQRLNADRPEARSTLGNFLARRGLLSDAEVEYKAALRLSPQYGPAAINLADLYRQLGRDADGETVLRATIAASPQDAGLHHALGLALTRLKRREEALGELRRAAELDPDRTRYAYVYAVGLHSAGHIEDAMAVLKESLARHPGDRDTLLALVSYSRDAGDFGTAVNYAEQLTRIAPGEPGLSTLIETLRRQVKSPNAR